MKTSRLVKVLFLLFISIVCFHQLGYGQNFSSEFLNKYRSNKFTVVTADATLIQAIASNESDVELVSFLNKLKFLRVITISKNTSFYCKEASKMFTNYEKLVSINEKGQEISIVAKNVSKNMAKEIILLVCEEDSLTIVNIEGDIAINKLSSLSSSIKKIH